MCLDMHLGCLQNHRDRNLAIRLNHSQRHHLHHRNHHHLDRDTQVLLLCHCHIVVGTNRRYLQCHLHQYPSTQKHCREKHLLHHLHNPHRYHDLQGHDNHRHLNHVNEGQSCHTGNDHHHRGPCHYHHPHLHHHRIHLHHSQTKKCCLDMGLRHHSIHRHQNLFAQENTHLDSHQQNLLYLDIYPRHLKHRHCPHLFETNCILPHLRIHLHRSIHICLLNQQLGLHQCRILLFAQ